MDAYNFESKDEVIAAAIRFVEEKATYTSATLQSARETKDLLRLRIGDKEREIFCVLYLNSQHNLIEVDELFMGTIDGAAVYPREIAKAALAHNAAAVILGHNHPKVVTAIEEALAVAEEVLAEQKSSGTAVAYIAQYLAGQNHLVGVGRINQILHTLNIGLDRVPRCILWTD